jgi:hypothetical protein
MAYTAGRDLQTIPLFDRIGFLRNDSIEIACSKCVRDSGFSNELAQVAHRTPSLKLISETNNFSSRRPPHDDGACETDIRREDAVVLEDRSDFARSSEKSLKLFFLHGCHAF